MMTFINWESLLKITYAENKFSCLSDPTAIDAVSQNFSTKNLQRLTSALYSDINSLILDYLTTEGYPSAAAKFSKEANLRLNQEEESVKARQEIQHAIHLGSIKDAIEALNELEPQVSEANIFYHILLYVAMIYLVHAPLI